MPPTPADALPPATILLARFQQIQSESADPGAELETVLEGDVICFRPGARFLKLGQVWVGGCFLGGLFVLVPLLQVLLFARNDLPAWGFLAVWLIGVGLSAWRLPYFTREKPWVEIDTRRAMLTVLPPACDKRVAWETPLEEIDGFLLLRKAVDEPCSFWYSIHALLRDDAVRPVADRFLTGNDTAVVTAERLSLITGKPLYRTGDGLDPRSFIQEGEGGRRWLRRAPFIRALNERGASPGAAP